MTDILERLRGIPTVTLPQAEAMIPVAEAIRKMMIERAEAADEIKRLRNIALKAFTVVEWVVGEGRVLPDPHFDADDLILEMAPLLGVRDSADARKKVEGNG